jgi:hypothetical protein
MRSMSRRQSRRLFKRFEEIQSKAEMIQMWEML